jgi:uncharacterized membrane protein YccC
VVTSSVFIRRPRLALFVSLVVSSCAPRDPGGAAAEFGCSAHGNFFVSPAILAMLIRFGAGFYRSIPASFGKTPMSRVSTGWKCLRDIFRSHRVELRLCLRVTVAALLTFALSEFFRLPLVLWTVLTAVIVTQLSLGRSLKATIDYFIGTLGGAVYSGIVAVLIPHPSEISLLVVLAVAIAPLALLAAMKPSFAVAPFTAVMVLLAPSILHVGPIESAIYRVFEVALAGMIALLVSLFVFPARAYSLAIDGAARMLDLIARALGELLTGLMRGLDAAELRRIQDGIGQAFVGLEAIGDEAKRERITYPAAEPELGPLLRTLLRLRHDLVMIGRTVVAPLPAELQERLEPPLARVARTAVDHLRKCSAALRARRSPPSLDAVEAALDGFAAEVAALRREGMTRHLSIDAVERFFTLGFALEQLRRNLGDLERCVKEWAQMPARKRPRSVL